MTTSEPTTYDERLWSFAQDKRLRRFRGVLSHPRSTLCDACGSSMPNHLYGLRDLATKNDYFVGASCLARLSLMLVVERPFIKADIISAYVQARGLPEKINLRSRGHSPEVSHAETGA
jgi:hypothetical protein